ncbi:hypothetical protein LY41_002489 [Prauserella halophila]|nr:hypothetical protein [Prauserella halophila]
MAVPRVPGYRRTAVPTSRRVGGSGSQGVRESGSQGVRESGSQGVRESGSRLDTFTTSGRRGRCPASDSPARLRACDSVSPAQSAASSGSKAPIQGEDQEGEGQHHGSRVLWPMVTGCVSPIRRRRPRSGSSASSVHRRQVRMPVTRRPLSSARSASAVQGTSSAAPVPYRRPSIGGPASGARHRGPGIGGPAPVGPRTPVRLRRFSSTGTAPPASCSGQLLRFRVGGSAPSGPRRQYPVMSSASPVVLCRARSTDPRRQPESPPRAVDSAPPARLRHRVDARVRPGPHVPTRSLRHTRRSCSHAVPVRISPATASAPSLSIPAAPTRRATPPRRATLPLREPPTPRAQFHVKPRHVRPSRAGSHGPLRLLSRFGPIRSDPAPRRNGRRPPESRRAVCPTRSRPVGAQRSAGERSTPNTQKRPVGSLIPTGRFC